jgi:hypothetical protein
MYGLQILQYCMIKSYSFILLKHSLLDYTEISTFSQVQLCSESMILIININLNEYCRKFSGNRLEILVLASNQFYV